MKNQIYNLSPVTFYKCLSEPTRLRTLLLILHENELCVCELVEALAESQPKTSRHLAQLRQCGLLVDKRLGQWVYYRLNPQLPTWITKALQLTAEANTYFIHDALTRLHTMSSRPNCE